MNAELITIGDEILIGQIIDTNSAWMAKELGDIGIRVKQITSVSDQKGEILTALRLAEQRADLILITGGLGPTKDDITKKTLVEFFETRLIINSEALENVISIFNRLSMPLLEVNRKQAEVPENCRVILNTKGTAPGMWFERNKKIWVSMPGVPHEMMEMMRSNIIPWLLKKGKLPAIVHQTLLTAGLGESFLAEKIKSIEEELPDYIRLAYLPKLGQVRLRLSAYGKNKQILEKEVKHYSEKIIHLLPEFMVYVGDGTLAEAVLQKLKVLHKTLALGESCTGGLISKEITSISGSSKAYLGGIIAYSNEFKIKFLGVSPKTIENYGAVSEETVREMAMGVIQNLGSDYALVTSGIAGPDGGTDEKPVGTVWVAWGSQSKIETKKYIFGKDRFINIERSATAALLNLLHFLKMES